MATCNCNHEKGYHYRGSGPCALCSCENYKPEIKRAKEIPEYIGVLEKNKVSQTPELTLKILTYEVGKLNQIDVYTERLGEAGYIGDRRLELGDTLTMISLLIEQRGYKVSKLKEEGLKRFSDRIKEVARKKQEVDK